MPSLAPGGALPPHRRAGRVARAALIATFEVSVAIAILLAIRTAESTPSDSPPPPLRVETVAAEPTAFRGHEQAITGLVGARPERIKRSDRGTFVLEGTDDTRLLVVPFERARLAAFKAGTTVAATGRVVLPPDSRRLKRSITSRTALVERTGAAAVLKATKIDDVS